MLIETSGLTELIRLGQPIRVWPHKWDSHDGADLIHELSDREWAIIQPLLPQKSRGVPRVDDRRGIAGIFGWFRYGTPLRDVPERYGPRTTLYTRFTRWRAAGGWDRILDAISEAHDGDIVMIDSSCVRVHQHGAAGRRGLRTMAAWDIPAAA